ncbi:Cysteine/Histidine-rich C1 domain family protein, putative [Theobroma cacao]|uniref:Cysteine/Histidine-rich C1 domain family protein, putative n=1 Tax=Theobroma cacao TaxID=3641 RepID=A0A061F2Z8_THECC|nr:Cysteine/Histidine-rich C1 domain family protein, putative [Theobroma cacao]
MEIKPFLHEHFLSSYFVDNRHEKCAKCTQEIDDDEFSAYSCESCNFWLHSHCAQQQLPVQITHPLHSEHCLELFSFELNPFICDKCACIACDFKYSCKRCSFNLDYICALKTNEEGRWRCERKEQRSTIQHFIHLHDLSLFNYRKTCLFYYNCSWCKEPLSGRSYGCLDCYFFLHESCTWEMPKTLQHPFHPSHRLFLQFGNLSNRCNACKGQLRTLYSSDQRYDNNRHYCCHECNFWLHLSCARYLPTLKNSCHEHDLTHSLSHHMLTCNVCGENCDKSIRCACCRCVQCDLNFHFKCASISYEVKHKSHRHELFLKDFVREDDLGEYYCDICEEKRNSTLHAYYCEKCKYVAHMECVLNEQKSTKKSLPSIPRSMNTEFDHGATTLKVDGKVSIEKVMEQGESKQGSPEFLSELGGTIDTRIYKSGQLKMQVEYFNHEHPLDFHEVFEENGKPTCQVCKLEICGPSYVCKTCGYWCLHKACYELPPEVLNPLHPHPLSLLTRYPDILPGRFICDECGDISEGFLYFCFECRQFKVDVKCGGLSGPRNQGQRLKEMDRKTKISHANHEHMLVLGNAKKGHYCSYCQLEIFGLAYCCLDCDDIYILHESCLDFPEKMQHPFHPLHLLVVNRDFYELCDFCGYGTLAIVYSCFECDLHLHVPCLNSLRQALRFKFGTHKLDFYYIGIGSQMLKEMCWCLRCDESCTGPFYFCKEAYISFHLECFPMPQTVKSTHHIHPLVLKNSFVEDDSGEYYCDICEEKRFREYHIYYCEECQGMFIAHIECVFSQVEEVLSLLVPRARKNSVELEEKIENRLKGINDRLGRQRKMATVTLGVRSLYQACLMVALIAIASFMNHALGRYPRSRNILSIRLTIFTCNLAIFGPLAMLAKCNVCGDNCDASGRCAFYRCVQCDLNFHFKCASIPSKVKHESHRHKFFFKDFVREDDLG